jgi:tetratricopeptide (TPR) repeat protein
MARQKKRSAALKKQVSVAIPERPAAIPSRRRELLMLAAVLLVSILIYLRCLGNGFVFDDDNMILHNRYIGAHAFFWNSFVSDSWWFLDPDHLPQSSYYRPLQDVWLGLNFRIFGLNPFGWHAAMVGLNTIVVWLVFKIAARLTANPYAGLSASLLFALLPFHAEAVVWASAIVIPMSAALELESLYLFMTRAGAPRRNLVLALGLYALALFSHESAVIFPALVAAYVFFLEPVPDDEMMAGFVPRLSSRNLFTVLTRVAPFATETIIYLIIRFLVLGFITRPMPVNHMTAAEAFLTVPRVLVGYLGMLVMPWAADSAHHLPIVTSPASPAFIVPIGALAALAVAIVSVLRKSPRRRLYLFCAIWMAIAIAPMMNLRGIFQGALLQDRYLYLPSLAWCVILADLAVRAAGAGTDSRRTIVWVTAYALVSVCGIALWNVQARWRDDLTFYTRLTAASPEEASWHYAFGVALEQRGDLTGAQRELKQAVRLDPVTPAIYDLGVVDSRLGHLKEAVAEEAEGLRRLAHPPADAYVGLAQLYELSGDPDKGEEMLKYAATLPGGAHVAALARAQMKMNHGDRAGAQQILRDLVVNEPSDPRVWTMMGMAAGAQKSHEEALADFERAVALAPRDPFSRFWAAYTLYRLGRDAEALEQCRQVLAISPNDRNTQALMAKIERRMASPGSDSLREAGPSGHLQEVAPEQAPPQETR